MNGSRAVRTRTTSSCASAIRQASAWWWPESSSRPSTDRVIRRASVSTSAASTGSASTGRLNPCRRACPLARAFPAGVLGPPLLRPLRRLAKALRALVIRQPPNAGPSAPPELGVLEGRVLRLLRCGLLRLLGGAATSQSGRDGARSHARQHPAAPRRFAACDPCPRTRR